MGKDDFWVSADVGDTTHRATDRVKRTPAYPDDNTTTFEDYIFCKKGGPLLFPYDASGSDFGDQLNDFINLVKSRTTSPFVQPHPGQTGAESVTIQLPFGTGDG